MELIHEVVASYFNIKIEDLRSQKRPREIAFPRQIAMYLCCELTDNPLTQIAQSFGKKDHSTVIHAREKIDKKKSEDKKLGNTIKELTERLQKM